MEPLQSGAVLGGAKRLSASDIEQAKMMYNCSTGTCMQTTTNRVITTTISMTQSVLN